jgi:wyosine [tRNA(Phe)-imidazoG37] synthetase (radical SAM superfamily)
MPSHIFGPVASRRLGRSLGVDLVPYKTCNFDCVYCELGPTTFKTFERHQWVETDDLLAEVKAALDTEPEYITLGGSGEPTLHSGIGDIINGIKAMTDIPLAILTNGSLLWEPDCALTLMDADLILPSLDAFDERSFQHVNRPHEDISFDLLLGGLLSFRDGYSGQIWLEVFLLEGETSELEQVERIAEITRKLKPDKIQLNTVHRPPAESYAQAVAYEKLLEFAPIFGSNCEVIGDYSGMKAAREAASIVDDILNLLMRRPCSIEDIAYGLGIHRTEVLKAVKKLLDDYRISCELQDGVKFYRTIS